MKERNDLSKMSITCVIPAFNAERTICRAVSSALRQAAVRVQVIVVNHGSSDKTSELVSSRFKSDPKFLLIDIKRRSNEMRSAARPLNVGFSAALKKNVEPECINWLLRLDADDFLTSDNVLQRMLVEGKFAPLINGNLTFFDDIKQHATVYGPAIKHQTRDGLLSGGAYGTAHHATLIRSDILENLFLRRKFFYDENLAYGEDLEMTMQLLRIIKEKDFRFVPISAIYKFIGSGTISNTSKKYKVFSDMRTIFNRFSELPRQLFYRLIIDLILRDGGVLLETLRHTWGFPAKQVALIEPVDYRMVQNRMDELVRDT